MTTDVAEPGIEYTIECSPTLTHSGNHLWAKLYNGEKVPFAGHLNRQRVELETYNQLLAADGAQYDQVVGRGRCRIWINDLQVYAFEFEGPLSYALIQAAVVLKKLDSYPVPLTSRDSIASLIGQDVFYGYVKHNVLRFLGESGQLEAQSVSGMRKKIDLLDPLLQFRTLPTDDEVLATAECS